MAFTFRDFFQGLADSAPQVANLIYQKAMFDNEQQWKEREFSLKQAESEAAVASYEASTERSKSETDRINRLVELEVEASRLSNDQQRMANLIEQGKFDSGYYTDKNRLELQQIRASIQSAIATARSQEESARLAHWDAMLSAGDFGINVAATLNMMGDKTKSAPIIDNLSKLYNGEMSLENFYAAATAAKADVDPAMFTAIQGMSEGYAPFVIAYRQNVEAKINQYEAWLDSLDKKEQEQGRAALGLRKGYTPEERVQAINNFRELNKAPSLQTMINDVMGIIDNKETTTGEIISTQQPEPKFSNSSNNIVQLLASEIKSFAEPIISEVDREQTNVKTGKTVVPNYRVVDQQNPSKILTEEEVILLNADRGLLKERKKLEQLLDIYVNKRGGVSFRISSDELKQKVRDIKNKIKAINDSLSTVTYTPTTE